MDAKIARLQGLEQSTVATEKICSGLETFHSIYDQVEMVELRSDGIEKVSGHAAGSSVQHGRELRQRDRGPGKLAARTATQNDLLDGVARYLSVG